MYTRMFLLYCSFMLLETKNWQLCDWVAVGIVKHYYYTFKVKLKMKSCLTSFAITCLQKQSCWCPANQHPSWDTSITASRHVWMWTNNRIRSSRAWNPEAREIKFLQQACRLSSCWCLCTNQCVSCSRHWISLLTHGAKLECSTHRTMIISVGTERAHGRFSNLLLVSTTTDTLTRHFRYNTDLAS